MRLTAERRAPSLPRNPSINAISTLLLFTSAAMLAIASRFTKITIEV